MLHKKKEQKSRKLKRIGNDAGGNGMFNLIKGDCIMNRKNFTKMFVLAAVVSFGLAAIMPAQSATVPKSWNFGTDSGRDGTGDFNLEEQDFSWEPLEGDSLPWKKVPDGRWKGSALTEFSDLGAGQNKDFTVQSDMAVENWTRSGGRLGLIALADNDSLDAASENSIFGQIFQDGHIGIRGDGMSCLSADEVKEDVIPSDLDWHDADLISLTLDGKYTESDELDVTFGFEATFGEDVYEDSVSYTYASDKQDGQYFGFGTRTNPTTPDQSGEFHSFQVIPEPSTLALLGLAGLLLMKRRRL